MPDPKQFRPIVDENSQIIHQGYLYKLVGWTIILRQIWLVGYIRNLSISGQLQAQGLEAALVCPRLDKAPAQILRHAGGLSVSRPHRLIRSQPGT